MNDDLGKCMAMVALVALFYYAGWRTNNHMLLVSETYLRDNLSQLEEGDVRAFYKNVNEVKKDVLNFDRS